MNHFLKHTDVLIHPWDRRNELPRLVNHIASPELDCLLHPVLWKRGALSRKDSHCSVLSSKRTGRGGVGGDGVWLALALAFLHSNLSEAQSESKKKKKKVERERERKWASTVTIRYRKCFDWHAGRIMLATPRNFTKCRPQVRVPRVCLRQKLKVRIYLKGMCAFSKLHKRIDCLLLCLLALQNRLFFITVSSQEYCVEAVNIQYKIQLKNSLLRNSDKLKV